MILLLLEHAEGARRLADVLQILRLHHDVLLVRVRDQFHWGLLELVDWGAGGGGGEAAGAVGWGVGWSWGEVALWLHVCDGLLFEFGIIII